MKPFLSWVPNHAAERRVGFFFVSDMLSSIIILRPAMLVAQLSDGRKSRDLSDNFPINF
jgi:hypothetical protein